MADETSAIICSPDEDTEKEREDGHQNGDARRPGSRMPCQAHILPCGQFSHHRNSQRDQPARPEEDQQQDKGNEDEGGDDSFHGLVEDTPPGRGLYRQCDYYCANLN
jgi:hypothetical protein